MTVENWCQMRKDEGQINPFLGGFHHPVFPYYRWLPLVFLHHTKLLILFFSFFFFPTIHIDVFSTSLSKRLWFLFFLFATSILPLLKLAHCSFFTATVNYGRYCSTFLSTHSSIKIFLDKNTQFIYSCLF